MTATIRLVALTAIRDRLFAALFILLVSATAVSLFLGGAAINERLEAAVVFAAGSGRIIMILGLAIFAAFHIQALFETREIEAILARALSRMQFVIAYWLGLSSVALVPVTVFACAMGIIGGFHVGLLVWAVSLGLECVLMLAVTLFAGLMLQRATATVLFALGFYTLTRLIGFFVAIESGAGGSTLNRITAKVFDVVLLFIPRLDLFSQTRWLVYGASVGEMVFVWVQSLLFLAMILLAAIVDITRKQF